MGHETAGTMAVYRCGCSETKQLCSNFLSVRSHPWIFLWSLATCVTCPHLPQRLVRKLPPNYSSIRASTDGGRGLVTCSLSHLHSLVTRKWVKIPLSADRASNEVTLTWCKPNECNNEQFHCLDNSCSNRIIPLPSSICILSNAVYWRYVASCNSMTLAK